MPKVLQLSSNLSAGSTIARYNTVGHGTSSYNTIEAWRRTKIKQTSIFSELSIYVDADTRASGTSTITFRNNGADGNQTLSIGFGATGIFVDTTNTDSVTANNYASIKFVGGASGTMNHSSSILKGNATQRLVTGNISQSWNSGTRHMNIMNSWTGSNDEDVYVRGNVTLDNLRVYLDNNSFDAGGFDIALQKGDVDVNSIVSISFGTTGEVEDVTNSDDVVLGDEVIYEMRITGSPTVGTLDVQTTEIDYTHTSDFKTQLSTRVDSSNANSTEYLGIIADLVWITPESGNYIRQPLRKSTWSDLGVYILSNSSNYTTTVRSRVNQVNGNQILSITTETGWLFDVTNSDTIADDDIGNYTYTSTAGTGNVAFQVIQSQLNHSQLAVPDGDSAIGSWTDEAGGTTNIYTGIDEKIPDDTDYIHSEENPTTNSKYVATLSNVTDPGVSTDHVLRYRYRKDSSAQTINLIVRLKQGASTVIASATHNGITTTWTNGSFTLSGAEADNITDYTDLRIEFDADVP